MKRIIYSIILVLGLQFAAAAQHEPGNNVQWLKIAFITKHLSLTTEEAQKFWPVYNEYFSELRKAKQEQKEDLLAFEEAVLNIRKKYRGEFRKIFNSEERVNKALTAEREFNNVVRKELLLRAEQRKAKRKEPLQQ